MVERQLLSDRATSIDRGESQIVKGEADLKIPCRLTFFTERNDGHGRANEEGIVQGP